MILVRIETIPDGLEASFDDKGRWHSEDTDLHHLLNESLKDPLLQLEYFPHFALEALELAWDQIRFNVVEDNIVVGSLAGVVY